MWYNILHVFLSMSLYIICLTNEISQVHISQGTNPTSMTISWITKTNTDTIVYYGINRHIENIAYGNITAYDFNYPQYNVYESGIIHHVTLTNLLPSTTYNYICGNIFEGSDFIINSFTTLPEIGSTNFITFGIIGDIGQTNDTKLTLKHIQSKRNIQMILHAGDLSYADCNQKLWDSYGLLIEPVSSKIPWMVGPGNHEIEFTNDGQVYLAFEERYKMPAIAPAEFGLVTIPAAINSNTGLPYCCPSTFQSEYNYGNAFYSFDTGLAHIIYLNPYSISDEGSKQYKWLQKDLKSVQRYKTPWIIVVMHCPWYNSNKDHHEEKQTVLMRDSMEPLLNEYKVNIIFSGHVHAYERTYPVYKNNLNDRSPVYITIGDGGNIEGHASKYYEQPEWSAFRNGTQYGYGTLTILNKNKMEWKWHRNIDGNFGTKDSLTLCNIHFGSAYC